MFKCPICGRGVEKKGYCQSCKEYGEVEIYESDGYGGSY